MLPLLHRLRETSTIELLPQSTQGESQNNTTMPIQGNKRVLAVIEDLMFTVKVADAVKRAGLQSQFVKTEKDTMEALVELPLLAIIDLNCTSVNPIELILKMKQEAGKLPLLGFVSHIQGELKQKAQEAGCLVMARSAFSQNLPQILRRHAGAV